jgi:hypothetical protein
MRTLLSSSQCWLNSRPLFGALVLASLTPGLPAQDRLSPASLSSWQATGRAPAIDATSGAIEIPAGSQLVRNFPGSQVTVQLLSQPYFQANAGDWPALEVGPAALSFIQDGAGGGLVLLGDTLLTLPQSIALGPDGRSLQPLGFSLSYDRTQQVATFVINGESYVLAATALDDSITVALSAGKAVAWRVDRLEVVAGVPATANTAKSTTDSPGTKKKQSVDPEALNPPADAVTRKLSFDAALELMATGRYASGEEKLFSTNRHKPGTIGWYTEAAGKLTQIALVLRQQYDARGAIAVSLRADTLLALGEKLAAKTTKKRQHAEVFAMRGFLKEELMRDSSGAREAYEQAKEIDPSSPRADQALKRLDEETTRSARVTAQP